MDSNKEDIIVNYPKSFILGSKFSYSINPKTKYSFIDNLIPLEKQKQDERDYRLAINMLRGTGRIHDIVDPNLNCSEKTWISTEFKLNQGNVEINGDINNIDKEYFPNL